MRPAPDTLTMRSLACPCAAARRRELLNYIIFLRVTPILPNTFINVASPIVGVPLAPFALGKRAGCTGAPESGGRERSGGHQRPGSLGRSGGHERPALHARAVEAGTRASRLLPPDSFLRSPLEQAPCWGACPTTSLRSTRAATWASSAPSQTCEEALLGI